jgi:hypothetical protein
MPDIIDIPYLTRAALLDANKEAVSNEFSTYCKQDALEEFVKEENIHPITAYALDSDGNLVCRILVGLEEVVFVALTQARYNSLPTAPVDMAVIGAMLEASVSSKH